MKIFTDFSELPGSSPVADITVFNTQVNNMSPAVGSFKGYRFEVETNDHDPPHLHIKGQGHHERIRLNPVEFLNPQTCRIPEPLQNDLIRYTKNNNKQLTDAWRAVQESVQTGEDWKIIFERIRQEKK